MILVLASLRASILGDARCKSLYDAQVPSFVYLGAFHFNFHSSLYFDVL